jgi:hypothetical protein
MPRELFVTQIISNVRNLSVSAMRKHESCPDTMLDTYLVDPESKD